MPQNRPPRGEPQTAVAPYEMTDEMRAALLSAQQDAVRTPQRLPQLKILPAGANRFEFVDSGEQVQAVTGVILYTHARNTLWRPQQGTDVTVIDLPPGEAWVNRPLCSSVDGVRGTPLTGFHHAKLGRAADGTETIECASCPYNLFSSKGLLTGDTSQRGKAVQNQASVFFMFPERQSPTELVLSPMSVRDFDSYITRLTNLGRPMQTILTTVTLNRVARGTTAYSVAVFEAGDRLPTDLLMRAMEMRGTFMHLMDPHGAAATTTGTTVHGDDETLPF